MKRLIIILLSLAFSACNQTKYNNESGSGDIIKITDVKNVARQIIKKKHNKDVVIYDVSDKMKIWSEHAYALNVYRNNENQTTKFIYLSEHSFEKMSYRWISDTTLFYKLFNSTNKLSYSFTYNAGKLCFNRIDSINNVPQ